MNERMKAIVKGVLVLILGLFVLAAIYLVVNALYTEPVWTSITFAVVLLGLPVYYIWFANRRRPEPAS